MDRRKNFSDTLAHKKPAGLVIDFGGNPLSSMEGDSEARLLRYLGFEPRPAKERPLFGKVGRLDERLLEHFDVDTRSVGEILAPLESHFRMLSPTEYTDEWGITRTHTGLYWEVTHAPLRGASLAQLERYPFPDPDSIDPAALRRHVDRARYLYEKTDYVVCAEHPVYGIFELGCWMCGFEDFLMRMALEPAFVHRFFERVLEYQKRVIELYYGALGGYIHYTSSGDDFATQTGPFFSPQMFRELVAPYFAQRIAHTRRYTKAAYLHHSCGSVVRLLDDILACGVDILNPIQPRATGMQPRALKRGWGGRVVFHGGIDTQRLLPFCSEAEIDRAVHDTIQALNQDGGYIFAAAHNIQPDVRPEKVAAMLYAAAKYRGV